MNYSINMPVCSQCELSYSSGFSFYKNKETGEIWCELCIVIDLNVLEEWVEHHYIDSYDDCNGKPAWWDEEGGLDYDRLESIEEKDELIRKH